MRTEQKRKLRNISLLALLGLIGGTFAFTAFNQQAINDRLRDNEVEVGGRVHDYYNRDTENKDVFVENYGQTPIMARIRLSEFMEIQGRGQDNFTPVVDGTSREDVENWTTWLPSAGSIGTRTGTSASFNQYSNLTFGWTRGGQDAPWYLPTFNHVTDDHRTAAAGHARDYFTSNATDGTTNGATHPGDGTDAYWTEDSDSYDNSNGDWFGSQVIREVAQNLPQQKPPMTLQEWEELPNAEKIGDFWVVDHTTGWAYWASQLQVGEATSYLLDAAEMKPAADAINGSYYYAIHVSSGLVDVDESEEFLNDGEAHDPRLEVLLEGIRNNAVDDNFENPAYNEDSHPDEFRFSAMYPGRIFTMAGEQYRYLENMGAGNHLIIRNDAIRSRSWNQLDETLSTWHTGLDSTVQAMVQPVANEFTTGEVPDDNVTFTGGDRWIPDNLEGDVAADITQVVSGGTRRAFALSLADVTRLSGEGLAFPNHAQRGSLALGWWWLRTPAPGTLAWGAFTAGTVHGLSPRTAINANGGVRPALIINQPTN